MILTDVPKETRALLRESGLTWTDIAVETNMTRQSAYQIGVETKRYVPEAIVKLVEALGYDIEIEFVRR